MSARRLRPLHIGPCQCGHHYVSVEHDGLTARWECANPECGRERPLADLCECAEP